MNNKIHVINTKTAPNPFGPYVQAISINNLIFISGQIPIIPNSNKIPDNIYDQTYQSLNNIRNIIQSKALKINNIVKTTLFITNIHDLPEINFSYKKFFTTYSDSNKLYFPARSCVEVSKLPKNAKIEIEAIAISF